VNGLGHAALYVLPDEFAGAQHLWYPTPQCLDVHGVVVGHDEGLVLL
jgi:hypothetical protein